MNKYIIVIISDILGNPMVNLSLPLTEYQTEQEAINVVNTKPPTNPNAQYAIVLKENIDILTGISKRAKIVYIKKD